MTIRFLVIGSNGFIVEGVQGIRRCGIADGINVCREETGELIALSGKYKT